MNINYKFMHPLRKKVVKEVSELSSGTIASLTNLKEYDKIEKLHYAFTEFTINADPIYEDWNNAWRAFLDIYDLDYNEKGITTKAEYILNTLYVSQPDV